MITHEKLMITQTLVPVHYQAMEKVSQWKTEYGDK